MKLSKEVSLLKERDLLAQKIGPLFGAEVQNPGNRRGPEGPEQDPGDHPSGKEEELSSAPCPEITLSLFPRR
jgi:hypothetical protein